MNEQMNYHCYLSFHFMFVDFNRRKIASSELGKTLKLEKNGW